METCAKCGADNKAGVVFCGGCGAKFVPKKKIPAKYIIGAIVLLLAAAVGLHFLFDAPDNAPAQPALIGSTNVTPSTGVARKVSPPSPPVAKATNPTCPNSIQDIKLVNSITLGKGTNCVTFTLNNGEESPWIYAYGSSFLTTALGQQPFETIFSNGYVEEDGAGQKVNSGYQTNQFRIEAQEDNTQFVLVVTP